MGRYRASKKRRKRRHKAHESDPEIPGTETRGNSPAWNSWDELSLLEHGGNDTGGESDDMEVTKRLSCLNFSVIPCAMDPGNFSCGHEVGNILGDEQPSEVELVTSATYMDVLPTDRESLDRRQSRKRASRRRPNKKVKKMKSSSCHGSMHCHGYGRVKRSHPADAVQCHPLSRKSPKSCSTSAGSTPVRVYSPAKRMMEVEEEDTVYLFSDTSATCEIEMLQDGADGMFDCTPPTREPLSTGGYSCHNDLSGIESELSESSTDSGCEGDDEESSVERSGRLKFPGWWEKEPVVDSSADEEDEKFSQILRGTFPLLSRSGQRNFSERLTLPEFKHPGKFGIYGSGRKKRRKPSHPSCLLTPRDVHQRIVKFILDSSDSELKFELVSRAMCRTILSLAGACSLECVVEQKKRLPVASPLLRKTPSTRLVSGQEVEQILRSHGRDSPTMFFKEQPEPLVVVGGKAPPLAESNVGNRMLQEMGWKPGTGLGPQGSGIQDPILTYIRPRNMGLGY